ncbi:pyridine nucleotide-disulfide oxidoreductase/dicluster-binding protein [Nitratidesulfovibrio liaohensis]|uniref:pyridine nucleotide-disulfide oxidoreductase/dicluster-binding protein n=1 Tax=Nitratidesulfovibrio liaohensis TaxID=2604158 RepID=UPI0028681109|nr:pyridine nucleotide-disulfide oxidoreductase/dicluster-binding protein [Nitratidesulfovibrio liaohensis]
MDQTSLRDWESRCIQEEPPRCQAACPLHVDARAFLGHAAHGRWREARGVLERTMPLPGVLARLCDAPCQAACLREEAGGAIAVGALERACAALSAPAEDPRPLPGRGLRAAVLGGGLAALTVAWDLAKKGHAVTLAGWLEDGGEHGGESDPRMAAAGRLAAIPPDVLPPDALRRELDRLAGLKVRFAAPVAPTAAVLEEMRAAHGAVFVAWSPAAANALGLPGRDRCDALTPAHPDLPGVFCGGWPVVGPAGAARCIDEAADGRHAATSMDRHLTGVSLEAGRERQGPFETRLFTSLKGVEAVVPVALPALSPAGEGEDGTAPDIADRAYRAEAARCLQCQCLECVKVCPYLEKYGDYPKKHARRIYNNLAIVKGVHQANRFINSCSLCGLCGTVCPTGFDMAPLCHEARRTLVHDGKMPPSTHEFALDDMAFSNGPHAALLRAPAGATTCAWLFLPGCQLAASAPDRVAQAWSLLADRLPGGTGIALRCCGALALWAGRDDLAAAAAEELRDGWNAMGRPTLVVGCPSCATTLRTLLPDLPQAMLWTVLAEYGVAGQTMPAPAALTLHDPCAAREDEPLRATVRGLLTARGVAVHEPDLTGHHTECCGYGGLMAEADPDLARTVIKRRADASDLPFVTYCAMCRDRLAEAGNPASHLLDLLLPPLPGGNPDPAAPGPHITARQENRARLRDRLLREAYGETPPDAVAPLTLRIGPDMRVVMDRRRIVDEDLRGVITEAERAGRYFIDADTGMRLACLRRVRVTHWVGYEPVPGGAGDGAGGDATPAYAIRQAYAHRMVLPQGPPAGGWKESPHEPAYLPASGNWSCACGGVPRPLSVELTYLGSTFNVRLLTCPDCGQVLVDESLALGKMLEVEQLLEDK